MNSGFTPKSVAVVFVVVLAFYFGGFHALEYVRTRKGPWQVAFEPNSGGSPAIVIAQPSVGVTGTKIVFHGESTTNPAASVRFDKVEKNAAFGEVIYEDLTFMPGVVTFNLFGHEVELMPRVLVINKREIPWQSSANIDVWPTNKPAIPPLAPKGNRPKATR